MANRLKAAVVIGHRANKRGIGMELKDLPGVREAIRGGNIAEVARLFDENPDFVFIETPFGSWLDFTVGEGQLNIVKYLVSFGFDVNRLNHHGRFPICVAAESGNAEIVQLLLSSGAIIHDELDDECANPMFAAVRSGSLEVVKTLLDHGLDPLREYENGKTVINFALLFGYAESAEFIIDYLSAGNSEKKAALHAEAMAVVNRQAKPELTRILPNQKDLNAVKP